MQVLTGSCDHPVWVRGGRTVLEMGPLSSPVVTSYRLPIVTVGLSLTVFAVLRLVTERQMEGRTYGIGLAKVGTMH